MDTQTHVDNTRQLSLLLLGKPRLMLEGRTVDNFPTAKTVALLGYLAIERHTSHTRDQLIDLFWPDYPNKKARQNLSKTLSRLRRLLGNAADIIQSNYQTIEIAPDVDIRVDVADFMSCVEVTNRHTHVRRQSCLECYARLAQAVQLVRGELLIGADVGDSRDFEQWLLIEREQLHQLHLEALCDLADGSLEQAAYRAAIAYARAQIELEAWRERAYLQLIRALALDGQEAAALAEYARMGRVLSAELGVQPSSAALQLHTQIKSGQLRERIVERDVPLPAISQPTVTHNLPANLLPTIGRETEIAAICSALTDDASRLVTLIGQGGSGKTRLALEVGWQLSRGNYFVGITYVSLAGVDDVYAIAGAIAHALQLKLRGQESSEMAVLRHLHTRRHLLILDNFEQLLAGVDWLLTLLRQASGVQLLVTSRVRLGLLTEDMFRIEGLPVPPLDTPFEKARDYAASQLFLDRARRQEKRFRIDRANWPHVVHISQMLEGLPLGIELASTWITELTVDIIAANMAAALDFLATNQRDFAQHQRSLRHVFEQSWQRLEAKEQAVLAALALMRGTFTTAAAQSVGLTTPLILRWLRHKSLLRSAGRGRIDMHEVVRQYALEKLALQPQQQVAASRRHAAYYLQVDEIVSRAQKTDHVSVDQALQAASANIHAAWRWATENGASDFLAQAMDGVNRIGRTTFFSREPQVWLKQLQAVSEQFANGATAGERMVAARAWLLECAFLIDKSYNSEAAQVLERAAAIIEACDAPEALATLNYQRGRVAMHAGEGARALLLIESALAFARQGSDRMIEAFLMREIGSVHRQRGQHTAYIAHIEQARALYMAHGERTGEQAMTYWLGIAYSEIGNYWQGRTFLKMAELLNPITGSLYHLGAIESSLARNDQLLGQAARAVVRHRQALIGVRELDDAWRIILLLNELAIAESELGLHESALKSAEQAVELALERALVEMQARARLALGYVLLHANQLDRALETFAVAERQMGEIGRKIGVIESQICAAWIVCCVQDKAASVQLDDALAFVANNRLEAAFQHEHLYWFAYQAALKLDSVHAPAILRAGRGFVQSVLDGIEEPALRDSYAARGPVEKLRSAPQVVGNHS